MPLDSADRPPLPPDSGAADRHARVLAAAMAAADWARARRASWSGAAPAPRPLVATPPAPALPIAAAPVDPALPPPALPIEAQALETIAEAAVAAAPAAIASSEAAVVAPAAVAPEVVVPAAIAPEAVAPAIVAPAGPSAAARALALLRSLVAPAIRWLPRLAAVALLATAVLVGRPYFQAWRQRLTAPKTGVAVLESVPTGSRVLIDGQDAGTTPITTTLPAGAHSVEFRYRKATRTVQVVVAAGGRTAERLDWTRKPSGSLRVKSAPSGAKVLVDGTERGVTPLTLDEVTVGRHTVAIQSSEGNVERTVTVTAGDRSDVDETIFAGWLAVFSPFDLTITERGRALRLDDRNQVMLQPGTHEIHFANRALGFTDVRRVDVTPGAVTTLSLTPPKTTLSVTASSPADVFVDGKNVGQTPLASLPVDLGTHDVALKSASGDRRDFTITATVKPVTLTVDFSKPGT